MNKYISITKSFRAVYIVDFSSSLCSKARERFARLGWSNVHVLCMDARKFNIGDYEVEKADWVSFSYSLSMIPECVINLPLQYINNISLET